MAAIWPPGDKQQCRIGFVSDVVYPFNVGGRERRLWEITRRLKMSRIEIHIYTMKWWSGENTLDLDGVQLHAICKQRPLYHGERRSIMQALMFGLATLKLIVASLTSLTSTTCLTSLSSLPASSAHCDESGWWLHGTKYGVTHTGSVTWVDSAYKHSAEWLAARTSKDIVTVSHATSTRLMANWE